MKKLIKLTAILVLVLVLASCGTVSEKTAETTAEQKFEATYDYTVISSNDMYHFYEITATYEGSAHKFLCRVPCKKVPDYSTDATVGARMDKQINTLNAMAKSTNVFVYVSGGLEYSDVMLDIAPAEYKGGNVEYFKSHLNGVWFGQLEFSTVKERYDEYYLSDHHWNAYGMDKAYREIVAALSEKYPDITARVGTEHVTGAKYVGSIGRMTSSHRLLDTFVYFDYDLPEHETKILRVNDDNEPTRKTQSGVVLYASEVPVAENMASYSSGKWNTQEEYDHYVNFYPICDQVTYTGNSTGRNLLFIGDSFSLGLQELLASHFDTTYFFYSDGTETLYKNRDFAKYVADNGITDVIVIEESARLFYDYYDYSGPALCRLNAE